MSLEQKYIFVHLLYQLIVNNILWRKTDKKNVEMPKKLWKCKSLTLSHKRNQMRRNFYRKCFKITKLLNFHTKSIKHIATTRHLNNSRKKLLSGQLWFARDEEFGFELFRNKMSPKHLNYIWTFWFLKSQAANPSKLLT